MNPAKLPKIWIFLGLAASLARADSKPAHSMQDHGKALGIQSLDVWAGQGKIHVLTVNYRKENEPAIEYASMDEKDGSSLTAPVRVDQGMPPVAYANRGNDIQITAHENKILVLWTVKGTGFMNSGPLATARSSDGGKTWQAGKTPADDGTTIGHRFMDLAATSDGKFHAVWLDNRGGPQGLYYAQSSDFGKSWSRNQRLDESTCECCWNRIGTHGSSQNLYVLYRDIKPRDMSLATSADLGKTWVRHPNLDGFGWDIDVCPHVGGGLGITGQGKDSVIHALTWTGKAGSTGLHYQRSSDGGRKWSRMEMFGDKTAKRADLAASKDGRVAVVWDALVENESAVFSSASPDGGKTWSTPSRLSHPGAPATHPRVVAAASGFKSFWTEKKEGEAASLAMAALEGGKESLK